MRFLLHLFCALTMLTAMNLAFAQTAPVVQDYLRDGQLAPLPAGKASLYRVPWRSNVRTVSAYDVLQGVGVYYKHIPAWSIEENTAIMQQMAAVGVKRMRLAPHHTLYLHKDWDGPSPAEWNTLRSELTAAKRAGIRPCVTFVHFPAMGEGDEIQKWMARSWNKGLLPVGAPGTPEYKLFFDKTFLGLKAILDLAREAGFTEAGSYDIEMGQNLWWGFPAMDPFPGMTWEMLQPGGQIYNFEVDLMRKLRDDGYLEPTLQWGQSYHYVEKMSDAEVPAGVVGRAISYYSPYAGVIGENWTGADAWPAREPLTFQEGRAPKMVLAKPEGFMADFSRRDNLHQLLLSSKLPVAITSLGVVPEDIPDARSNGLTGWDLKSRGLTRSLIFWLNQGADFVLLHSAYEGKHDEMSHALLPYVEKPLEFRWQESQPLTTMRALLEPLQGAKPLAALQQVNYKYSLTPDRTLVPAVGTTPALMASDAVTLLTVQIDEKRFATAAYVQTPNIAIPLPEQTLSLQIDKAVASGAEILNPLTGKRTKVKTSERNNVTTVQLPISDSVTWLLFTVK